jgi:L-iditol 2-dehydrogenase
MRAVVKSSPEFGIDIKDVPMPRIENEDHVLLEVEACGICGTDLHFYEWAPQAKDFITLPRVIGHEVAGVVHEVGKNVQGFRVGDRVVTETWGGCGDCYYCRLGKFNHCVTQTRIGQQADGGMTDYLIVPAVSLYKIPPSIPMDQATLIEPLGVALRAMERITMKPGDHVFILGPGPIGLLAGLLSMQNGASTVSILGLKSDHLRLKKAKELGMKTFVLEEESAESMMNQINHGHGPEVVIETSGARAGFQLAIDIAKKGGSIGLIGLPPKSEVDVSKLVSKELDIYGSWRRLPSTWYRAIDLIANKKIDVTSLITHVFDVDDAEKGFELLHAKEAIKVIVKPKKKD